jgi:hypothetical protein
MDGFHAFEGVFRHPPLNYSPSLIPCGTGDNQGEDPETQRSAENDGNILHDSSIGGSTGKS